MPTLLGMEDVEDEVPDEAEVEWSTEHVRDNHAGGPYGMTYKQLNHWMTEARAEKYPGYSRWQIFPNYAARLQDGVSGSGVYVGHSCSHPKGGKGMISC